MITSNLTQALSTGDENGGNSGNGEGNTNPTSILNSSLTNSSSTPNVSVIPSSLISRIVKKVIGIAKKTGKLNRETEEERKCDCASCSKKGSSWIELEIRIYLTLGILVFTLVVLSSVRMHSIFSHLNFLCQKRS